MSQNWLSTNLNQLFFEPFKRGADRLCILTLEALPSMASWLMKNFEECKISNVKIELIVSGIRKGVDDTAHIGFKELHNNQHIEGICQSFVCSYLYRGNEPKNNLYIWLKGEIPMLAFCCTGGFTQSSFLIEKNYSVIPCDPFEAYNIFENSVSNSIFCNHSEVEEYIILHNKSAGFAKISDSSHPDCVKLSLLARGGETGKRSGLNWGQRKGRNKNQAYIPLPTKIARTGFFPLGERHFFAYTDDGHSLLLRVEQENDKAITTPLSNALLGEYFRNRLDLAYGEYVTKQHLLDYGRTDVVFYKIDDEQFYMDFSID